MQTSFVSLLQEHLGTSDRGEFMHRVLPRPNLAHDIRERVKARLQPLYHTPETMTVRTACCASRSLIHRFFLRLVNLSLHTTSYSIPHSPTETCGKIPISAHQSTRCLSRIFSSYYFAPMDQGILFIVGRNLLIGRT